MIIQKHICHTINYNNYYYWLDLIHKNNLIYKIFNKMNT